MRRALMFIAVAILLVACGKAPLEAFPTNTIYTNRDAHATMYAATNTPFPDEAMQLPNAHATPTRAAPGFTGDQVLAEFRVQGLRVSDAPFLSVPTWALPPRESRQVVSNPTLWLLIFDSNADALTHRGRYSDVTWVTFVHRNAALTFSRDYGASMDRYSIALAAMR
jgi:hypothetical protein